MNGFPLQGFVFSLFSFRLEFRSKISTFTVHSNDSLEKNKFEIRELSNGGIKSAEAFSQNKWKLIEMFFHLLRPNKNIKPDKKACNYIFNGN
jgi:hypothetical protein